MAAKRRPPPDPFMRSNEPLLWLGAASEEVRTSTAYFYDSRLRADSPHLTMQYTLSGCGFYQRESKRTLLRPGMAFIDRIPGPFLYGYATESNEPYRFVYMSLTGPVADRWLRRIHSVFGHVLDFGSDRTVGDQMLAMAQQRELQGRPDRYLASAQTYALLMQIHSVLMRSRLEQVGRVKQATGMIEQYACDVRFSIATLARELDCSREHLTRQFQLATGVSPSAYLSQHRLRLVARELRQTDDKIEAIARRCGFSGANYLCRSFRQRWGVTPAMYRASPGMMLLQ